MCQHTPGPWKKCGGSTPHFTAIHSEYGYIVHSMADHNYDFECGESIHSPDYEQQQANARLIAAAPDLLAACKAFVDCWPRHPQRKQDDIHAAYAKAEAALAKAEGHEPATA